jgi:NAD-dependent dihydropyrimidine dehydrogenase PreA subunit
MSVLINSKICDNSKECDCIKACPNGVITWDDQKKTLIINNSKCTSCGLCAKACMVGAIKVARNETEYQKIKEEIKKDPRKATDLFTDRYGAETINEAYTIDDFNLAVIESNGLMSVEFSSPDSIQCLIQSIPIKELFDGINIKYRRQIIENSDNNELVKRYKIKEFPSLLFFKNGKLIGKIEDYYEYGQKDELIRKIKKIIL